MVPIDAIDSWIILHSSSSCSLHRRCIVTACCMQRLCSGCLSHALRLHVYVDVASRSIGSPVLSLLRVFIYAVQIKATRKDGRALFTWSFIYSSASTTTYDCSAAVYMRRPISHGSHPQQLQRHDPSSPRPPLQLCPDYPIANVVMKRAVICAIQEARSQCQG